MKENARAPGLRQGRSTRVDSRIIPTHQICISSHESGSSIRVPI